MCLPWYELRKSTKNEVNIYGRRHCKEDELYDCVFGHFLAKLAEEAGLQIRMLNFVVYEEKKN